MSEPREKYLSPKELAAEMKDIGVDVSENYVRDILRGGAPHISTGQRMFAQLSRVLVWLEGNPGFSPRAAGGFSC